MDIVEKARLVAISAHDAVGQVRKYTGEPYWHHCERVAASAMTLGTSEEAQAAAWLHDTVEDTALSIGWIKQEFGEKVAAYVWGLTECQVRDPSNAILNRQERKQIDTHWMGEQGYTVQTLKMLDVMDNFQDLSKYDPGFCRKFIGEVKVYVEAFKKADPLVIQEYKCHLENAFREVWAKDPLYKTKGVFDKDTDDPYVVLSNLWVKIQVHLEKTQREKIKDIPSYLGMVDLDGLDLRWLILGDYDYDNNRGYYLVLREVIDPFNPTVIKADLRQET